MSGAPHSNRRYQVLGAARRFIEENKKSPTLDELAEMCGIKSPSSVAYYLKQLEREGLVKRGERYTERSIKLCGTAKFMRLPTVVRKTKALSRRRKAKARPPKAVRAKYAAECFERAVELGLKHDAEIESRRDGVFHDNKPLFRNGTLSASKVG
jgi:SOS-response transcriptional repressor LexA